MTMCECGNPIPAQVGRARPRKWCTTCRPPRNRTKPPAAVLKLSRPGAGRGGPVATSSPTPVTDETRATLAKVGRETSWQGAAALTVAREIDRGNASASGLAALVKSHREAMTAALEGTAPDADVLDLVFADEDAASS